VPPGRRAAADMGAPPDEICPYCKQPRPLLSVSDAAYVVGVTRKTIYRWIDKGILAPVRLPSGLLRIRPESLMRIMHPGPSDGARPDPHDHHDEELAPVAAAAAAPRPRTAVKRTRTVGKPSRSRKKRRSRAYAEGE